MHIFLIHRYIKVERITSFKPEFMNQPDMQAYPPDSLVYKEEIGSGGF